MKCSCGFKFSKPGEYRNCVAFVTKDGLEGIICPKCGKIYIMGKPNKKIKRAARQ